MRLLLSVAFVRETHDHHLEAAQPRHAAGPGAPPPWTFRQMFVQVIWRERALSAVSQAGLVNNLNGRMVWGLFP